MNIKDIENTYGFPLINVESEQNRETMLGLAVDLDYAKEFYNEIIKDKAFYRKEMNSLNFVFMINYAEGEQIPYILKEYSLLDFMKGEPKPKSTFLYAMNPIIVFRESMKDLELVVTDNVKDTYDFFSLDSFVEHYENDNLNQFDGSGDVLYLNSDGSFSEIKIKGINNNIKLSEFDLVDFFIEDFIPTEINGLESARIYISWANK